MAVKIRLKRGGAKKKPSYRIIVANATSSRDSASIAELGYYRPKLDGATASQIHFDQEKLALWFQRGAQPTEVVIRLLRQAKIDLPPYIAKQASQLIKNREHARKAKEEQVTAQSSS